MYRCNSLQPRLASRHMPRKLGQRIRRQFAAADSAHLKVSKEYGSLLPTWPSAPQSSSHLQVSLHRKDMPANLRAAPVLPHKLSCHSVINHALLQMIVCNPVMLSFVVRALCTVLRMLIFAKTRFTVSAELKRTSASCARAHFF